MWSCSKYSNKLEINFFGIKFTPPNESLVNCIRINEFAYNHGVHLRVKMFICA